MVPLKKHRSLQPDQVNQQPRNNNLWIHVILGLAILFVVFIRLRLLSFPFERDEGEYAYMGMLMLDGHAPYTLAGNMKLPGTYFMYALIMSIFGESIQGVHFGLLLVVVASMILIFRIARTFFSKVGSVIAVAVFGILGTSWTLLGQAAHATHFVSFFSLFGILFILKAIKSNRGFFLCFLSGVFFSLAFLCKQSGLFFVFMGYTVILYNAFHLRSFNYFITKSLYISLGFIIPVALTLGYIYFFGNFQKFWFWTVQYLLEYGSQVPLSDFPYKLWLGLRNITANFSLAGYLPVWIISLIGLLFLFMNKATPYSRIFIASLVLFSFLTVVPGLYFRNHYFITMLPVVGLLNGFVFEELKKRLVFRSEGTMRHILLPGIFVIIISLGLLANTGYLFTENPRVLCKKIYGSNPFAESIAISKYLRNNTKKDDKIVVLGSEPQIYFYAKRYAATSYIYTYSLVEIHDLALTMQQEMVREIEATKPRFLLFVEIGTSWLYKPNCETYILQWANQYTSKEYHLVGFQEVFADKISMLKTDVDINNLNSGSENVIYLFRRND